MMNVYRQKRRIGGKLQTSQFYRGRYRLPGDAGCTDIPLGVADKGVALEKLSAIVRAKRDEAAGIVAPQALRDGAAKRLADHLEDFRADLTALGRDEKYVYIVGRLVGRLIREAGWKLPKDVSSDSFSTWRAKQFKLSAKSLNEYLNSANALLNWMQRHGRILANPLKSVERVDTRGKSVRLRRAFTDAEMSSLLSVAGSRGAVYMAASLTGLRRGELQALKWGDVHLEALRPFLSVRASTTKNHQRAEILLRDDLVAELRALRPGDAAEEDRVFAGGVPDMKQFRADLAAAKVEEWDAQGRKGDFHALRHTLATNLNRAGVSPRLAMKMMRHSDMRLTMVTYTDPELLATGDALESLPRHGAVEVVAQATGTDDANTCDLRTLKRTQPFGVGGQNESTDVTVISRGESGPSAANQGECLSLSLPVTSGQDFGKAPRSQPPSELSRYLAILYPSVHKGLTEFTSPSLPINRREYP